MPRPTVEACVVVWGLAVISGCDSRHRVGTVFVDAAAPVPGPVSSVAVDGTRSCAVTTAGSVFCWGLTLNPATPDGAATSVTTPKEERALAGAARIIGSDLANACALMSNHEVRCWGENYQGQLGRGDVGEGSSEPGLVPGLLAEQLVAGSSHRCARLADGTVSCWGSNGWGECGTFPTPAGQASPVPVPGLTEVVEIAAALGHSCARRSDGSVWCFGFNQYGQIGAPDDGSHRAGLTRVSLSGPATRIGCTGTMTCAAMDGANGDEVWCWGVGKSGPEPLRAAPPTHLLTGGAVREFVTSVERLCIVRASTFDEPSGGGCTADGSGVPGMGVEGFRLAQVMGGPWATMAISERTACAVDIRGVVSCWGDNANGQIGTGQAGDIWPNPTLVHW